MQIVIDISEKRYKDILRIADVQLELKHFKTAEQIIANGTPLPKGHGKLIAEPTEEDIAKTIGGQNDFTECIKDAVKAVFDNAHTIIEADKEHEDGNDD